MVSYYLANVAKLRKHIFPLKKKPLHFSQKHINTEFNFKTNKLQNSSQNNNLRAFAKKARQTPHLQLDEGCRAVSSRNGRWMYSRR